MLPKERDHRLQQLIAPSHDVSVEVLPVVVIPPVENHLSDTEEVTELVQRRQALLTLRHDELVRYLETGPVAASTRTARLPYEADREASFSVYETDHPTSELDQPFLLVFRTRHVVTLDSFARRLTSPRDLPAPGRRQPLYVVFRLRRDLCFW